MALEDKDFDKTTTRGNLIQADFSRNNDTTSATNREEFSNEELLTTIRRVEKVSEFRKLFYNYYKYQSGKPISSEDTTETFNRAIKTEGDGIMSEVNWQEKYIDSLDNSLKEIKTELVNSEFRVSEMINKHLEYSTHLDKQRHEEILSINQKIDNTNRWIIGLVITTVIGVAAMVISSIYNAYNIFSSIN